MDYCPPTGDIQTHIKQGDQYRVNNLWDAAISEYQRALKDDFRNIEVLLKLGQAYEGKGIQSKETVFLRLALDNYWKVIALDANDVQANNRLINLGIKLGQLDTLISEYKSRLEKDPGNAFLQDCWKRLQALSMVAIPPTSGEKMVTRNWGRLFLESIMIITLIIGIMVVFMFPKLGNVRLLGVVILLGYLGYKVASRRKAKKNSQW